MIFFLRTLALAIKGLFLIVIRNNQKNMIRKEVCLGWLTDIARNVRLSPEKFAKMKQGFFDAIDRANNQSELAPMQKPVGFFYPGLRAVPFWDSKSIAIVEELERNAEIIRDELVRLRDHDESFSLHPEADLVLKGAWGNMHFFAGPLRFKSAAELCPATMEIIERIRPKDFGLAYFSAQAPRTSIKPHYGPHNLRLRIHLGLIIPRDCSITIAKQTRTWEEGRCLVIDDSFLHFVRNDSDTTRFILLLDIWHPDLSQEEIAAFNAMFKNAQKIERLTHWFGGRIHKRRKRKKLEVNLWKDLP